MEILLLIVVVVVFGLISAALTPSSFDKGAAGERLIHKKLAYFESDGKGKLLSNIYVPRVNGGTTEIDVLLIHPKGLFVFESKNYSGWIFGNERHKNWTQTLPKGWRGDVHKERFYNPILQNALHIEHLMYRIERNIPVWSVIVFSDECELKDITISSKNVRVVQSYNVAETVEQICHETQTDALTEAEVLDLYNRILIWTTISDEERKDHAQKAFGAKHRL